MRIARRSQCDRGYCRRGSAGARRLRHHRHTRPYHRPPPKARPSPSNRSTGRRGRCRRGWRRASIRKRRRARLVVVTRGGAGALSHPRLSRARMPKAERRRSPGPGTSTTRERKRAFRLSGEERAVPDRDAWAAANDEVLRRIARDQHRAADDLHRRRPHRGGDRGRRRRRPARQRAGRLAGWRRFPAGGRRHLPGLRGVRRHRPSRPTPPVPLPPGRPGRRSGTVPPPGLAYSVSTE